MPDAPTPDPSPAEVLADTLGEFAANEDWGYDASPLGDAEALIEALVRQGYEIVRKPPETVAVDVPQCATCGATDGVPRHPGCPEPVVPQPDTLACRAEMFAAKLTPHTCQACNGIGWTVDENWSPEGWQMRSGYERTEGEGLIPCGACSLGDWSTWRDERTEPTTVIDGLTWDEQIEVGDLLRAAAVRLRRLDRIEAALGDVPDWIDAWIDAMEANIGNHCTVMSVSAQADLVTLFRRLADALEDTDAD